MGYLSRFLGICHKLKDIAKTNVRKTLYFNFKMLPFRDALRVPIFFYGKTSFRNLDGKVKIEVPIQTGMIKVGPPDSYVDHCVSETIWQIYGKVIFTGPILIARGSYFHVAANGVLKLGSRTKDGGTFLGSHVTIICFDSITIGDCVRITWDCQLYDTSFHYLELIDKGGEIKPLTAPITIGDRVWVGNRSTISKGAYIPSDTIVSNGSLVNKNWSQLEPYTMLAGTPAIPKAKGIRRIFNSIVQEELDNKFGYSRNRL